MEEKITLSLTAFMYSEFLFTTPKYYGLTCSKSCMEDKDSCIRVVVFDKFRQLIALGETTVSDFYDVFG